MFLRNIRDRIGSAFAGAIAAVFFLICGAVLAFVISPQQALEWRRIQGLPELDAASYAATATGEAVAITGTLAGNEMLTQDGLAAFYREVWEVEPPDPDVEDDEPEGSWERFETVVPALTLEVSGGSVTTLSASSPTFGGSLHETVQEGTGPTAEGFGEEWHAEGSIRTSGFKDGDLITAVGHKGSTGDLAPDRLFGGDRVQLVQEIRTGARVTFGIGIGMMVCSPLVLVVGVLAGLFGKRK